MRISDWSSDVCSSDLPGSDREAGREERDEADCSRSAQDRICQTRLSAYSAATRPRFNIACRLPARHLRRRALRRGFRDGQCRWLRCAQARRGRLHPRPCIEGGWRSEEHTSELQSLMRISYAVLCLKKKNRNECEPLT